MEDEQYLDSSQVAKMIGYTVGGLRAMVKRGDFPGPIKQTKKRHVWAKALVRGWMRGKK